MLRPEILKFARSYKINNIRKKKKLSSLCLALLQQLLNPSTARRLCAPPRKETRTLKNPVARGAYIREIRCGGGEEATRYAAWMVYKWANASSSKRPRFSPRGDLRPDVSFPRKLSRDTENLPRIRLSISQSWYAKYGSPKREGSRLTGQSVNS